MMIHPVYLPPWPRGSAKIPFALTLLVFARDKNVTKYLAEVLAFEARHPQVAAFSLALSPIPRRGAGGPQRLQLFISAY